MANVNADNVLLGAPNIMGGVFVGTTKSPLPTDAKTKLDPSFICAGYVSDDGIEEKSDIKSESVKAWGGVTVCTYVSEAKIEYKITFIESLNEEALKLFHGDENVTNNNGKIAINMNSSGKTVKAFVIQLFDKKAETRIVIPKGQVTSTGGIKYKHDTAIGYEVTITALVDTAGNNVYKYIEKTNK